MTQILIDLAIHEKQPAEELKWYDLLRNGGRWRHLASGSLGARVAKAVKETHPDLAATRRKYAARSAEQRREAADFQYHGAIAGRTYNQALTGADQATFGEGGWPSRSRPTITTCRRRTPGPWSQRGRSSTTRGPAGTNGLTESSRAGLVGRYRRSTEGISLLVRGGPARSRPTRTEEPRLAAEGARSTAQRCHAAYRSRRVAAG